LSYILYYTFNYFNHLYIFQMGDNQAISFTNKLHLKYPIFAVCIIGNYIVVAGGGGGKNFGVRNKVQSFEVKGGKLKAEPVYEIEYNDEIPVFIGSNPTLGLITTCINNLVVIYDFDAKDGSFVENLRLKVIEFYDHDLYANLNKFNEDNSLLAVGNTDGSLK